MTKKITIQEAFHAMNNGAICKNLLDNKFYRLAVKCDYFVIYESSRFKDFSFVTDEHKGFSYNQIMSNWTIIKSEDDLKNRLKEKIDRLNSRLKALENEVVK